jgi:hypothetical protein
MSQSKHTPQLISLQRTLFVLIFVMMPVLAGHALAQGITQTVDPGELGNNVTNVSTTFNLGTGSYTQPLTMLFSDSKGLSVPSGAHIGYDLFAFGQPSGGGNFHSVVTMGLLDADGKTFLSEIVINGGIAYGSHGGSMTLTIAANIFGVTLTFAPDVGPLGVYGVGSATPQATLVVTGTSKVISSNPVAPEPVRVLLVDAGAIISTLQSALPVAILQRQSLLDASQSATRDLNGRLFRLRTRSEHEEAAPVTPGKELVKIDNSGKSMIGGKDFKLAGTSPEADRFELFGQGDFGFSDVDDIGNRAGFDSQTQVATVGAECRLTRQITLGLGFSYLSGDTFYNNDLGRSEIEGFAVSPYISWFWRNFYADMLYSFGRFEDEIRRDTLLGHTATASPDSDCHTVNLNLGYNFNWRGLVTGPLLAVEYMHGSLDSYTENGGHNANVRVDGQDWDSLITRLGWQASWRIPAGRSAITPQVRVAWVRENMNNSETVTASLVNSPFIQIDENDVSRSGGYSASGRTPTLGRDFLSVGGGVMVEITDSVTVLADYEAHLLRDNSLDQFASIRASVSF